MGITTDSTAAGILASSLKGQTMHVPNLYDMFPSWPSREVNPLMDKLQVFISGVIDDMVEPGRINQKHKVNDYAFFASLWFPKAGWEELKAVTMYNAWAFVWDDQADAAGFEYSDDLDRALEYRKATAYFWRAFLGLAGDDELGPPGVNKVDRVNDVVRRLCEPVNAFYGPEQRLRLFREVDGFIKSCDVEQQMRLQGVIPTFAEYMELRMLSGAVTVDSALSEYSARIMLPGWIADGPDNKVLWDEMTFLVCIINDILSLKKEMKNDALVSAVPVKLLEGKTLSRAVDELVAMMEGSIERFELAATRLDQRTMHDFILNGEVARYVDVLRTSITGTVEYSIRSARYGIEKYLNEDGTLDIVL